MGNVFPCWFSVVFSHSFSITCRNAWHVFLLQPWKSLQEKGLQIYVYQPFYKVTQIANQTITGPQINAFRQTSVWLGKNEDLSNSDYGLVLEGLVWEVQKQLVYWDFHTESSIRFIEIGPKKSKYPVSSSCVNNGWFQSDRKATVTFKKSRRAFTDCISSASTYLHFCVFPLRKKVPGTFPAPSRYKKAATYFQIVKGDVDTFAMLWLSRDLTSL